MFSQTFSLPFRLLFLFSAYVPPHSRLKLFLEKFSILSCVLNSELPHNSRSDIFLDQNNVFRVQSTYIANCYNYNYYCEPRALSLSCQMFLSSSQTMRTIFRLKILVLEDVQSCPVLVLDRAVHASDASVDHSSLRCHVVEDFNRGLYDYIIATDEVPDLARASEGRKRKRKHGESKKSKKDSEYGVSRGIDFQGLQYRT